MKLQRTLPLLLLLALLAGCGTSSQPSALTAEERTQLYQTAIESARDAEMNEAIGILTDTGDDMADVIFELLGVTAADMSAFALSVSPMNIKAYGIAAMICYLPSGIVADKFRMRTLAWVGFIATAVLGGGMALGGAITLGTVQAFLQYVNQIAEPVTEASYVITSLQAAIAGAERVFALLDEEEERPDAAGDASVITQGHVEFRHVRFGYTPERTLIHDLNLEVHPNEMVAIVGPTGGGKTTLVNLLIRAYEPTAGEIRLDGVPLGRYSREGLSRCFSVVLQETVFFRGTVLDNLRYARPEATEAEVVHAAKLAHAHGFIQRLPQGYQTLMSGAAGEFSQGQYQLLAMARALVSRAPILILDEATSSVDTTTEQRLQQATLRLLEGRTCFLIAHRPSTIRRADRIFVVGERGIVESGTYDELMKKRGVYWSVLQ